MPELLARKIYEEVAHELFTKSPPPMEELFNNAAVRYRVGKIITEAASQGKYLDES